MNQYRYVIINKSPYEFRFPWFLPRSLFVLRSHWLWKEKNTHMHTTQLSLTTTTTTAKRSHSGHHSAFSPPVSLGSSCLWEFLRLTLFLMTLTVLRSIRKVLCWTFLPSRFVWYFPHNRRRCSWKEDHRNKVSFLSLQGTYYHHIKKHSVNLT